MAETSWWGIQQYTDRIKPQKPLATPSIGLLSVASI
jgi:hypothetical protein